MNIQKSMQCYYGKAKQLYHNMEVNEHTDVGVHVRNAFYKYRSRQRVKDREFKTKSITKKLKRLTRIS